MQGWPSCRSGPVGERDGPNSGPGDTDNVFLHIDLVSPNSNGGPRYREAYPIHVELAARWNVNWVGEVEVEIRTAHRVSRPIPRITNDATPISHLMVVVITSSAQVSGDAVDHLNSII